VTGDRFTIKRQVRPRHCDAQAMVYAARYHEFCEDAFLDWLEVTGTPYEALRASGVDLVIADSRYVYRRPAALDDRLDISLSGETVAESTLAARFEVRRDDDVLATADVTYVAVHDGRRCPLPGPLRRLAPRASSAGAQILAELHEAQAALYTDGDATAVERLLHPDIVWRVPGNNRIAGTYRGVDEVVAYMRRRHELAGATFRMYPREVLVGPTRLAAVVDGTVTRGGTTHTWSTIGLYRIRDGRFSECSLVPLDAAAFDDAWS
jgi:YbgC/YbaW family acyl-CoA thioester hydrolase